MTCPQHEALSAYADEAMTPGEHSRFRLHLQACPVCQRQLDDLRGLQQSLRALPSPTLGFDLASRLEGRLQRQPPRRPPLWQSPWQSLWGSSGWMPASLSAGLALASGVWLGGLLLGGATASSVPPTTMVRVFDPVPPGGLCAAAELCRLPKGML